MAWSSFGRRLSRQSRIKALWRLLLRVAKIFSRAFVRLASFLASIDLYARIAIVFTPRLGAYTSFWRLT